jgi:hypothetical protein
LAVAAVFSMREDEADSGARVASTTVNTRYRRRTKGRPTDGSSVDLNSGVKVSQETGNSGLRVGTLRKQRARNREAAEGKNGEV